MIVGISVSSEKVVMTEVKKTDRVISVAKSAEAAVPTGVVQNGMVVDIQSLAAIIKKLAADGGMRSKQAFVSLHGPGVIMRPLALPRMPEKKIQAALRNEVGKFLLSGEEAVIGYYRTDAENVFVTAAKKEMLSPLLEAVEKGGFLPVGVDVLPLAALRSLGAGDAAFGGKTVMLALVGAERANISVVSGSVITYSRDVVSPTVSSLAREIALTVAYRKEHFSADPVTKVVISGDSPAVKSLFVELSADLPPAEEARLFGLGEAESGLSRVVSAGLAMRGLDTKFPFDVNLLPPEKFRKMELEKKSFFYFGVVSAMFFILFAASHVLSFVCASYEKKIRSMEDDVSGSPEILAQFEEINSEEEIMTMEMKLKSSFIGSVEERSWSVVLSEIRKYTPSDVWLTGIYSKDGLGLVLEGYSLSQDSAHEFVNALGLSDLFDNPALMDLKKDESSGRLLFSFNVGCRLVAEKSEKND